jgi:RHS repeat-associated protein
MNRLIFDFTRAFSLFCLLIGCVVAATAQEPKRGFNPGGSYAVSDIETISTSGGNLSLSVPLGGLPAGRGGLKASVNLVYNSKLWDTYQETAYGTSGYAWDETRMRQSPDGGWRYAFKYDLSIDFKYLNGGLDFCDPNLGSEGTQIIKLMITLPDGSRHALRLDGSSGEGDYADVWPDGTSYCANTPLLSGTLTYFSHDGSFLRLDVEQDADNNWENNPWTLYLPDGGRVTGGNASQRIYDRNNNYIEVVNGIYNSHAATYLNDQVGRSVIVEYNSAANQDSVHVRGTNNELLTWNVLYTTIQVNKTYTTVASPYNRPLNQSVKMVSQITLPAQSGSLSYSFGYNANTANPSYGWGELSAITLPSGARASYVYRLDGANTVSSKNAAANNPTSKSLVYRPEYDLAPGALPSNTPCNTATETCVTEAWAYAFAFDTDWLVQNTTLTAPDGGVTRDYFNQEFQDGKNYKTERADGTVIERLWRNNTPHTAGAIYVQNPSANRINPYVKLEFTSIRNAGGNLSKTAIREYSQDKNGNVTGVKEYDWLAYASVPRDAWGRPSGVGGATLKRVTDTAYYNPTPDASDSTTADADSYHLANTPRLHGLAQSSEIRDAAGVIRSRTESFYDNTSAAGYVAAAIGNPTVQKSWDSTKGAHSNPLTTANSVSVSTQYNGYGSPVLSTDMRGTQTQFTYGAVNNYSDLYPTITKIAYGTAVEQVTTQEYDFYTGAVTRAIDPNGVATATTYDAFARPTLVKAAEGIAAKESRTATAYSDVSRRVIARSDLTNVGDGKLVSILHYDQMGRVRLSRTLENAATESETDETTGIKVQTRYGYSGANSYQLVSNPYRAQYSHQATGEPSMGWTRGKTDNGGRAVEAQTFNGATLPAPWGANAGSSGAVTTTYDAEFVTITDQAGKMRRSITDGLGQLIRVDEPDKDTGSLGNVAAPVQPTAYTYDALGNLTQVTQHTQTRTFSYSSLSRLTSATNPENGTVSYTYDAGGNVLTKSDARPVTIAYTYDALSRNQTVNYSDTTVAPDIERHYDNPAAGAYGRGRLWYDYKGGNYSAGSDVEHRAVDSYDALGRPLSERQHFKAGGVWSAAYATGRTYTRAGMVDTQTLPSGHTVNHTYDAAGRLQNFTGNLGDGTTRTYSTGASYDAGGRMTREAFGTQAALYHKRHYNTRGQLYDVRLSATTDEWSWNRGAIVAYYDGAYSWSNNGNSPTGADNNGNVKRSQVWAPGDDAASVYALSDEYFEYDALNRLKSVNEYKEGTGVARSLAFTQGYDYDRWGNRTINQTGTTQTLAPEMRKAFAVDAATNRLLVPGGQTGAMTYDAAGNQTHDSYTGKGNRTYDAENLMTSAVSDIYGNQSFYAYDAKGKRVRRSTPTGSVWQVYGLDGELLAEYAANAAPAQPLKEYGYRNGELLVTASPAKLNVAAVNASATNGADAPALAVDGNEATSWIAGGFPTQWIELDLGQASSVTKLRLKVNQTPDGATTHQIAGGTTQGTLAPLATLSGTTQTGQWLEATFTAASVRYVRVTTTSSPSWVAWAEIEVYGAGGGNGAGEVNWLVSDHLGTPRIIADRSGSLQGIRRHDYLPFGEEVGAGVGGRTTGQGYVGDNVRQKFTNYERDTETGMDYAQARYYSSVQGRFTSFDPLLASGRPGNPKTWNRYAYALDNPLRFVDPSGLVPNAVGLGAGNSDAGLMKSVETSGAYDNLSPVRQGQTRPRQSEPVPAPPPTPLPTQSAAPRLTTESALFHYMVGGGSSIEIPIDDIQVRTPAPHEFPAVKQLIDQGTDGIQNVSHNVANVHSKPVDTAGTLTGGYLGNITFSLTGNLQVYPNGEYSFTGSAGVITDRYDANPGRHRTRTAEKSTTVLRQIPGTPYDIIIKGRRMVEVFDRKP